LLPGLRLPKIKKFHVGRYKHAAPDLKISNEIILQIIRAEKAGYGGVVGGGTHKNH